MEWKSKQDAGPDAYGGEEESEEGEPKEKDHPVLPEFNEVEFLEKWDEEFPAIEMGEVDAQELDNDWVLSDDEI